VTAQAKNSAGIRQTRVAKYWEDPHPRVLWDGGSTIG